MDCFFLWQGSSVELHAGAGNRTENGRLRHTTAFGIIHEIHYTERELGMQRIKFYGIGGQGVVTAAKVLSQAVSIFQDEYAITVPAYGHERRGAPVYAHIIIDNEPVLLNCYVYEPDIIMVTDDTLIDSSVQIDEGCTEDTILVLNANCRTTAERYKEKYGFKNVYYADGTGAAMNNIGLTIPNSAMLGAMAKTGIVSIEAVENAIKESFGKKGESNANAAREAYEHTEKA
jgi:2-oxoacid:acceptor oxidoreductase gamma subunit (pyruvate/2-ketoisovalerate family)